MSEVMGVKVYMEHGSCATLIAMFKNEETYMACVPALETLAFENHSTISESCDEFVLTPVAQVNGRAQRNSRENKA